MIRSRPSELESLHNGIPWHLLISHLVILFFNNSIFLTKTILMTPIASSLTRSRWHLSPAVPAVHYQGMGAISKGVTVNSCQNKTLTSTNTYCIQTCFSTTPTTGRHTLSLLVYFYWDNVRIWHARKKTRWSVKFNAQRRKHTCGYYSLCVNSSFSDRRFLTNCETTYFTKYKHL